MIASTSDYQQNREHSKSDGKQSGLYMMWVTPACHTCVGVFGRAVEEVDDKIVGERSSPLLTSDMGSPKMWLLLKPLRIEVNGSADPANYLSTISPTALMMLLVTLPAKVFHTCSE